MSNNIGIGDLVRYRAEFLRSIGCYTGDMCFARGMVTALKPFGDAVVLASVDWDKDDIPSKVITHNLELIRKAR